MKKLSRNEMKNVMGGRPPVETGCYARCCNNYDCEEPGNHYFLVYVGNECPPVSGNPNTACMGGTLLSCSCTSY